MSGTCDLCGDVGGELVWSDDRCRVVRVEDPAYPGYCRVIWNAHVTEFSDLSSDDRLHLMAVIHAIESALRSVQSPHKINLASLGNMTPHLHWHVIPRWLDDPTFPQSIWSPPSRSAAVARPLQAALLPEICKLLNGLNPVAPVARKGASS